MKRGDVFLWICLAVIAVSIVGAAYKLGQIDGALECMKNITVGR